MSLEYSLMKGCDPNAMTELHWKTVARGAERRRFGYWIWWLRGWGGCEWRQSFGSETSMTCTLWCIWVEICWASAAGCREWPNLLRITSINRKEYQSIKFGGRKTLARRKEEEQIKSFKFGVFFWKYFYFVINASLGMGIWHLLFFFEFTRKKT